MKHLLEIYKTKRFKIISERMIEVDSQTVTQQIKKGRTILTCSCCNSSTFGNSQMCRHKTFFTLLPFFRDLNKKINKLLDYYETGRDISIGDFKELFKTIINDLGGLMR